MPEVKNIAGVEQATLIVDRNPANIAHTFRFYVYEIVTDALLLTATAVATDSRLRFQKDDMLPTSKTLLEMTRQR